MSTEDTEGGKGGVSSSTAPAEDCAVPLGQSGPFTVYGSKQPHNDANHKQPVLIADDDPVSLGFLVLCVRQAGFEPLPASSGIEALRIAQERRPRLAILDIDMTGANGFDVAHFLRAYIDTQVIFLSSHSENSFHQQALETGAVAYYVKPVKPAQIILTIRSVLSSSAANDRLRDIELQLLAVRQSNRSIDIATGVLMERHRLSREEALQKLHELALERGRAVHEVAREVLAARG